MRRYIPNFITCLNLFCGCISIVCTFTGSLNLGACFILSAAVFDFLDGLAARRLKAYSELGKQLDSLADMVSFGVAPASIMYVLLLRSVSMYPLGLDLPRIFALSAFLLAVFSALRLAKFNIDARQSDTFIGLPTPANAMFICSLALSDLPRPTENVFFLLAVTILFSYLLVAEIPLFSIKFKSIDWKSNKLQYSFVVFSALILLILHWTGLAIVILVYILISIIVNHRRKTK